MTRRVSRELYSGQGPVGSAEASAELRTLGQSQVIGASTADVGTTRERVRQGRLLRLGLVLLPVALLLVARALLWGGGPFALPHFPHALLPYLPAMALITLLSVAIIVPLLGAGRSPHVLYRPSEIDVRFEDVRGAALVVDEVVKTLNLFLGHRKFTEHMGGSPRRALLFEGPPGTGKTYMAKAMAAEAGVPFLFVSSSAFQSMYYGQTNRKIRSYFKALRKYARREGGAIGFIEEIDAIGGARGGMGTGRAEGVSGVVNELLVQLQSFDEPALKTRIGAALADKINGWMPASRQIQKKPATPANILVIGATNRAADLDPALVRPGRFDRTIYFDLPSRSGRREIIDYYLEKKAHEPELDVPAQRDQLAAVTFGYSPVMIEHLLDEALIWALRRQGDRLSWADIQNAKMTEEIGLAQPVEYAEAERRTIATHEAGHAVVAWLVGKGRKLDVLSIIKRKDALGLLAHSEEEERFLKTRTEMEALIHIAFGGMVAEEMFFGEAGSGVASDLKAATIAACQMIGSLGMGTTLVSAAALETAGGGNIVAKVLSNDDGRDEVEDVLRRAKDEVRKLLETNQCVVEGLRDALLERDELVGAEILDVIASVGTPALEPQV
ncbi:MAG TPA: AAA family ATPase [Acidimicrobiales bacterium]|nr:AAA family ATPase [Acidimicrobiales bacterium]